MSPAEWYAVALAGILVTLVLFHAVTACQHAFRRQRPLWVTNAFSRVVHASSSLVFEKPGWWSCRWSTVIWQLLLVGSNVLLVVHDSTDIESAAHNAGTVALLDMILFYLGPHLSFLADLLGVSLSTMKGIHSGMTLPFVVTVTFHAVVLRPS